MLKKFLYNPNEMKLTNLKKKVRKNMNMVVKVL